MIELLYVTVDIAALAAVIAAAFCLGAFGFSLAVRADAERARLAIKELCRSHDEFRDRALETIQAQRLIIDSLTREFDPPQNFN